MPYQSGASASTVVTGDDTTRSGAPMLHCPPGGHSRAGGRSDGLPRGAPASTQSPIRRISASDSEGSSMKRWMPMFLSTNHGGISRARVRAWMARAQGRTSA